MFDMAGAGSTSNFAQAGKAAARENERILQATLENSPNMGKIVQEAAVRRSKENIASLRAETKVQVAGLNEYAATKNAKELGDAEMDYKKSKRISTKLKHHQPNLLCHLVFIRLQEV